MKKILVTGVTKGIGLAVARRFGRAGYRVVGCAGSAESVVALGKSDPEIEIHRVDVADREALLAFGEAMVKQHSFFDVLVNNAGRFIPGQLHNEAEGVLEAQLATNLSSAYHLTRKLLPGMMAAHSGTIVNICSTASITPYTNGGSYCISKFALLGFSKVLREEMKPYNVRVVSVLPGATLTASWAGTELPPERFMQAEDVAEVVWLAATLPQGTVLEEILLRPLAGDIV